MNPHEEVLNDSERFLKDIERFLLEIWPLQNDGLKLEIDKFVLRRSLVLNGMGKEILYSP